MSEMLVGQAVPEIVTTTSTVGADAGGLRAISGIWIGDGTCKDPEYTGGLVVSRALTVGANAGLGLADLLSASHFPGDSG